MRDDFSAGLLIRNLRAGLHLAHYTCDMMSRNLTPHKRHHNFKNGGAAEGETL
jgi:hypothetical protein